MSSWPKREVLLLACGLCCVSFVAGYIAADGYLKRLFPALGEIKEAVSAVYTHWVMPRIKEPWERDFQYRKARYGGEGVQRNAEGKTWPGYTLFSASFEPAAYLVDMQGRKLHEWRLPFSAAWPRPPHIEIPAPDKFVYIRKAHVFPNGDLLAIYEAPGFWPYAYGLVRMDKDSRPLWGRADLIHHDFDVAADGRIHTLAHQVRKQPDPEIKGVPQRTVIDDVLVVLSPEGKEIERVSIVGAFVASRYAPLLNEEGTKDVLHTNSVQIVTPEIARIFPFVEPGQVLLSHNTKGAISILDPRAKTIVWARQVSRHNQHTARFVSNGTIGVFKNSDNITAGGGSRVATLDPATGGETWVYAGDENFHFSSHSRGFIQPLPNGNMLVTESNGGRVFEVTPAREVVWEYRVGHLVNGKTPAVFDAVRIEPASLTFLAPPDSKAQKP